MDAVLPATDVTQPLLRIAGALERLAAAEEKSAAAHARLALVVPDLADDEARWLWRIAGDVLPKLGNAPSKPESVDDPRTRIVMLGRNLAERLHDWALPEARRKAKWAAEKAAREERALREAEATFANNGAAGAPHASAL